MRIPSASSFLALAAGLVALAASGCSDPRYCDADTPCKDSAYPFCDTVLRECEAFQTDGGIDAPLTEGGQPDAQTDAPPADDGGCDPPQHQCGGYCYAVDDLNHCGPSCAQCTAPTNGQPTCDGTSCDFACDSAYWRNDGTTTCDPCADAVHCGPACMACSGTTPDCSGQSGACVCNGSSCSGTTPVCDSGTGACRACAEHSECASGACDMSGGACVPEASIVYLGVTGCSDSGSGTKTTPFCGFQPALTAALAGGGYLVIQAGSYSYNWDSYITDKVVVIIGAGADTTELVQTKGNRAVLKVVNSSNVWLEGLTLRGASGNDAHGVWCVGQSGNMATLTVKRCELRDNAVHGLDATYCTVTMEQSIVSTNTGGGVLLATSGYDIENCLVVENGKSDPAGSNQGGVFINTPGAPAVFINNTVAYNGVKSGATAGGVWCVGGGTVTNSIMWGNAIAAQKDCTIDHSDVQGSGGGSNGNIDSDPYFKGGNPVDYHLQTNPPDPNNSPCINAGTSVGAPTVDLDGKARTNTPDIGCYEAQ